MLKPFSLFLLVFVSVPLARAEAFDLEPKAILCHYRYATDKDASVGDEDWKRLEFRAPTPPPASDEVWTARPATMANSPFNALTIALTRREAAPDLIEVSIAVPLPDLEVLENDFFSGRRSPTGVALLAKLREGSATIPKISFAAAAAGFPNGYVVFGLKCEEELRGPGSIWPRIRRRL